MIELWYQNRYFGVKKFLRPVTELKSWPAGVALWAFFSFGCASPGKPAHEPGYLVVALDSSPTHLDPRYATDANSAHISGLIFDGLTRVGADSRPEPHLAERWEALSDRAYVFHLRKNVTFHDGKPLTAEDVKFTYEWVLETKNRSPKRAELQALKSVDVLGPHVIRFELSSPHAPFPESTTLGILPRGSPVYDSPRRKLIGSGPFSLSEFLPGEKAVLKSNPHYWGGAPSVSGLVFKIIPDAVVRALEFKKGNVDLIQNDIEPDMLPWLKRETNASISAFQGTIFQYLGTNLEHPVLRTREVRQAIAQAIDRELIIRHLLKGLATPATGLLSPLHWAYEPSARRWDYDPEEANRLLDRAGFPDPDGEGPLPRFKLSYKTTTVDLRRRIAEALKEQLRRVGIEIEVRAYEWGTFYSDIKKGNFHLYSLAWVGIADPDIYFSLFHSGSVPPHGNNRGRYRNPEIDRLLEQGRKTLDPEARRRIYSRVQKTLALDLPYIPLWWTKNVVVMKPGIKGFVPYPDGDLISLKDVTFEAPARSR